MKSKKLLFIKGIVVFVCMVATVTIVGCSRFVSDSDNKQLDSGNEYLSEASQEPGEHPEGQDKEPITDKDTVVQGKSGNLASNLVQNGEVAFDEDNIYVINKNTNSIEVRNESGRSTLFELPKKEDMYHRYSSLNVYNDSVYVVSSIFGEGKVIKRDFKGKDWEVLANGSNLQIYSDKIYYIYEDTLISKAIESGEEEILVEDVYDYCISEGNAVVRRINAHADDDFGYSYISDLTLYILNLANNELTEITRIKDFIDTASKVVLDGSIIYHDMAKGLECIDIDSGKTKDITTHITDTLELGFCDGFAVTEEKIYIVFLDPNKNRPKIIVIDKANTEKFEVVDCNLEAYTEYLTKLYEWCYTQGDPGWISINIYYANHELFVDRLGHYDDSLNWLGNDVACDEPWTSYWE